jgi:hypothetical protein
MNQLIHCINCDAVFLKTPFDQELEYDHSSFLSFPSTKATDETTGQVTERDDFKDFMKDHDGHRLEDLTVIEDSCISDKDYIEPVKVSYFKATNGKENFVVRKFRERIGEPLRYELVAGDYSLTCVSLDVQAREIEKQLMREFAERPLSKNKVDSFIRLYDHIIKTVEVKNLERIPEESANPLEVYYKMDDVTLMYLLRNCHHIFKGQDYSDIESFVSRHKDDGVLLLKAVYKIHIVGRPKAEKKSVPSPLPLESKKVKEMG